MAAVSASLPYTATSLGPGRILLPDGSILDAYTASTIEPDSPSWMAAIVGALDGIREEAQAPTETVILAPALAPGPNFGSLLVLAGLATWILWGSSK